VQYYLTIKRFIPFEKEIKKELEVAAEFDFIGYGVNRILQGDLTCTCIDLRLFT